MQDILTDSLAAMPPVRWTDRAVLDISLALAEAYARLAELDREIAVLESLARQMAVRPTHRLN